MAVTAAKLWTTYYRQRMNIGIERCRNGDCVRNATTFGHLRPRSRGGMFTMKNITLLCSECNQLQGDDVWPHLVPLSHEDGHWTKMEYAYRYHPGVWADLARRYRPKRPQRTA